MVITCGICFSLLNEPISWPCGHSFCLNCVRAQLEQGHAADAAFACPMCSTVHAADKEQLRGLVNHDLATRVAALTKGVDAGLVCQWCEDAPATIHCPDCPYVLCGDCNIAVHKNSGKRDHQPVASRDPRAAKSISKKCPIPKHEEYKLDFYCTRCEELCCAYCLQMGPHHMHENVVMSRAAAEARQRMGRDLESLSHTKNRMENQAHDLNRVCAQYQETYDSVESLVSDRFAAFHQQLQQRELEVRSQLQRLRDDGDNTLAGTRLSYLQRLNAINEAVLQYRRLQHGGADYEVLENRAMVSSQLRGEAPTVSGGVFRVNDLGDLHVSGLTLALDLVSQAAAPPPPAPSAGSLQATPSVRGMQPQQPSRSQPDLTRGMSEGPSMRVPSQSQSVPRQGPPPQQSQPPPPPQPFTAALTFSPDRDVAMAEGIDGTVMQCAPNASVPQIGIRANETFDALRQQSQDGPIRWHIRLDNINESKIGVVEKVSNEEPLGFYWRPMRQGQFDGTGGRHGPALRGLPVCRRGDIVTFSVDPRLRTLSVAVNGADYGVMLTDIPLRFCPCLVFRPGDKLTVLSA